MKVTVPYIGYANEPYFDTNNNKRTFVILGIIAVVIIAVVIAVFSKK